MNKNVKNHTAYFYIPTYLDDCMNNPLSMNSEHYKDYINHLTNTDTYEIEIQNPYYPLKKRKDISRAFNDAIALSSLHKGDLIIIQRLTDIAASSREALKKIERYSKYATIYILEFNTRIPYDKYRGELFSFFDLTIEECKKTATPPGRSALPKNFDTILSAYKEYNSSDTTLRKLAAKHGISRSTLCDVFGKIRRGIYDAYLNDYHE